MKKPSRPIILVVDDARAVRQLVVQACAPFDCEVTEANNGFNAFFAIENARPQLILLDVLMPIMEGFETLRRLKVTPQLADIPVIMLASPADRPHLAELTAMGAAGIVMKPFKAESVLDAIGRVITLQPTQK